MNLNIGLKIERYYELKQKMNDMEKELNQLKPDINSFVEQNGGAVSVGMYALMVTPCSRETFNLKEARKVLSEDTLSAFITNTNYTTLKINKN